MNQEKKLNILFLVNGFPSLSETFILNQIFFLLDNGHNVKVLAKKKYQGISHLKVEEYGLLEHTKYYYIPSFKIRIISFFRGLLSVPRKNILSLLESFNFFKYGREALNLNSFFKKLSVVQFDREFDIVHAHFGNNALTYYDISNLKCLDRSKLVVSFHGTDMKLSQIQFNKKRYKRLLEDKIQLTTNNPYGVELLRKIYPNFTKIEMLPVGLDTNYFRPINEIPSSTFNIIYCGRFVPFKAPTLIIEIANEIVNLNKLYNFRFQLIGAGPEEERVLSLIQKYNLEKYVELKGGLRQVDIIQEMNKADLFVLPGITEDNGRAETQGLVIQEAQAMGLPVIVSDAGGIRWGVLDGKTGYILEQKNIIAFVNKIILLKNNPDIRKEMGRNGRQYVKDNFDMNVIGRKLLEIYFKTLN